MDLDKNPHDVGGYLSPTLLYNLVNSSLPHHSRDAFIRPLEDQIMHPILAQRANFSMIFSPDSSLIRKVDSMGNITKRLINEYFKDPKWIYLGDLVEIALNEAQLSELKFEHEKLMYAL